MPALLEREVNGWFYNAYASRYETRDQLVRKLLRDEEDFVRILRYCYAMPRRTVTALFPEISSTRLDHLVGSGLLMEKVFYYQEMVHGPDIQTYTKIKQELTMY